MYKTFLSLSLFIAFAYYSKATVHTINNSGFVFLPTNLSILDGDSVLISIGNSHDAREVSQTTYNANGNTALPGGFQTPNGGGLLLPGQLTPGMHYYVCTPHASFGMKGTIEVVGSTGIHPIPAACQLVVYPNPAQEKITVTVPLALMGISYTIVNVEGRTLKQGFFLGGEQTIPIEELPIGYYVIIPGDANRKPIDFIKQ